MESYITLFMDKTITGAALLNFRFIGPKSIWGSKIKMTGKKSRRKSKNSKLIMIARKTDMEKEKNKREKLLKKAERVIHVGKVT